MSGQHRHKKITNQGPIIAKTPGKLTRGTIQSFDQSNNVVKMTLDTSGLTREALYYPSYYGNDGHFIGGIPQPGTPVLALEGEAGLYYIIAILARKMPQISGSSLVIQSDTKNLLILDPDKGITLGSRLKKISLINNEQTQKNILANNFDSQYSFSEASIEVDGIVRRDLNPNTLDNLARREDPDFDTNLVDIGFDPSSPSRRITTGSGSRNVPFVEKREIVYEFAHSSRFGTDEQELAFVKDGQPKEGVFYNRREARTDSFSLSQVAPNYLMETIKGTAIDIFGNILDLNRNILPIGKEKQLSLKENDDPQDAFLRIREQERKSIAFHFEINSRKGSSRGKDGTIATKPSVIQPFDFDAQDDYARGRSRFFVDIDKEGQFKINVPASSEKGNIPFLTRYENGSTINADPAYGPNLFSFGGLPNENKDQRRDVYLDSFAIPVVKITDPDNDSGFAAPIDRITHSAIQHGTAYHDISNILSAHRGPVLYEYDPKNTIIADLMFPTSFVSTEIKVSGPDANAGGRSGSINFDGSIDLNIGANTVDKQSMWLDTQGSIMGSVGRDINNVSMGLSLTGDLLIEVGGCDAGAGAVDCTPSDSRYLGDKRFLGKNFAMRPGAVDIRVYRSNGEPTVFRIDDFGVTVLTSGNMSLVAGQDLILKGQAVHIDAEEIVLYSGDPGGPRSVMRSGTTIL